MRNLKRRRCSTNRGWRGLEGYLRLKSSEPSLSSASIPTQAQRSDRSAAEYSSRGFPTRSCTAKILTPSSSSRLPTSVGVPATGDAAASTLTARRRATLLARRHTRLRTARRWLRTLCRRRRLTLTCHIWYRQSGEWKGHRSSRLGPQWRIVYRTVPDQQLFQVISITAHDYRRP